MRISELRDYPRLKKFASSLWETNNEVKGAALMVGAGFSRTAARCGDPNRRMPLWADLSYALEGELDIRDAEVVDPLRLAEQYVAYFGRRALIDLVCSRINDSAWSPGLLHKQLLQLPWKDVLTTNWDTLLERAAQGIFHPKYSVVNQQTDLATARAPRITKLHGTVGITGDLIFTQEDYRQYPNRGATFVNFARQVFIENELCLIGFSGDDPNFLQWAGWVRDRLDAHARRIFLAGNLNLSESTRKYLESINIAPIDFHSLVFDVSDSDSQHRITTSAFIEELLALRPKSANEWRPKDYSSLQATLPKGTQSSTKQPAIHTVNSAYDVARALKVERTSSPQWRLLPRHLIIPLSEQIGWALRAHQDIAGSDSQLELELLFEAVWRIERTYQSVPSEIADKVLSLCSSESVADHFDRLKAELLLMTLRGLSPAMTDNESVVVDRIDSALRPMCSDFLDISDERHAILASIARDSLADEEMSKHVAAIRESSATMIQTKAVLLAELGRFQESESLVAEAQNRLMADYDSDRRSLYLRDRLAWVNLLAKGISQLPSSNIPLEHIDVHKDEECDPWQYFEFLRDRLQKATELQENELRIEPSFMPGRFVRGSDSRHISNEPDPIRVLYGICNRAAIPVRWNRVSFLGKEADAACSLRDIPWRERLSLSLRSADGASSKAIDRVLARLQIACLSAHDFKWALKIVQTNLEYWLKQISKRNGTDLVFALEKLGILMEAIGRLSVRASPNLAKSLFERALNIGSNASIRSVNIADPLRTLVRSTWQSIPPHERASLLPDILDFPIGPEVFMDKTFCNAWPEINYWLIKERPQDSRVDRRIAQLIEYVGRSPTHTRCALIRLYPLARSGLLTSDELCTLRPRILGDCELEEVPETGLLSSALLSFFYNDEKLSNKIKQRLFEADADEILSVQHLEDIFKSADDDMSTVRPSPEQAYRLFELLCSWRPRRDKNDFFGMELREDNAIAKLIGLVLSNALIPNLPKDFLSADNLECVLSLRKRHNEVILTEGLIYFAAHDPSLADDIKRLIVKELHQDDPSRAMAAAEAINRWRKAVDDGVTENLCSRLIHVAASSQTSALHGILSTLNDLYSEDQLTESQVLSLIEAVPIIFDASEYSHQKYSLSGLDATTVSLTRRECARLAAALILYDSELDHDLQRIIALASEDPLPEVRFSLSDAHG